MVSGTREAAQRATRALKQQYARFSSKRVSLVSLAHARASLHSVSARAMDACAMAPHIPCACGGTAQDAQTCSLKHTLASGARRGGGKGTRRAPGGPGRRSASTRGARDTAAALPGPPPAPSTRLPVRRTLRHRPLHATIVCAHAPAPLLSRLACAGAYRVQEPSVCRSLACASVFPVLACAAPGPLCAVKERPLGVRHCARALCAWPTRRCRDRRQKARPSEGAA